MCWKKITSRLNLLRFKISARAEHRKHKKSVKTKRRIEDLKTDIATEKERVRLLSLKLKKKQLGQKARSIKKRLRRR